MAAFPRQALEDDLRKLPPKLASVVGLRAAMRILPLLASQTNRTGEAFAFWPREKRASYLLAAFRSYQTSVLTNCISEIDPGEVGLAALSAANAANATTHSKAYAAFAVLAAASYAANAATRTSNTASFAANAAAFAANAANAAALNATGAAAAAALKLDLGFTGPLAPQRSNKRRSDKNLGALTLIESTLWPLGMPLDIEVRWSALRNELRALGAGFDVWESWYQDRLNGTRLDLALEERWGLLSEARLAQSPAQVNGYLQSLTRQEATQPLNHVRAIFIGHGGVGKTSLISALHGEKVVAGGHSMTPGVAIHDSGLELDEKAGVFTHEQPIQSNNLVVHFWDFGGQVMAHATHQFFMREQCLYVIVLDGRKERDANEEAEYWLEHVRAFGKNSPVVLVGNKADEAQVNLDLRTLKEKYPNVTGFYPMSCTQAQGRFRSEFQRFKRDFKSELVGLSKKAERFTKAQFAVLQAVREQASKSDFLRRSAFEEICAANGIAAEGVGGRTMLLDLFDKLGIVMHFPQLPYFEDFVLNPRWLTYGVYQILYSSRASAAKGRIRDRDVVEVLKPLSLRQPDGRVLNFPASRCQLIADAMVAFRVAYRLPHNSQSLVMPALLQPEQPDHGFAAPYAMAFQFDFRGFLPRNVLPTLIVDHHTDIARTERPGEELVWQNGVVFNPKPHYDARALVRANYHERSLDVMVEGSDAGAYLGLIRDSIVRTLATMPHLPFEEKVYLTPAMRCDTGRDRVMDSESCWMNFKIVQTALKNGITSIPGPDGHVYDIDKILRVTPVSSDLKPADIFLSYKGEQKDRDLVAQLDAELAKSGYSVWFDRDMIGGQRFRDVIDQRLDTAKAVIVLWTEASIESRWVRHEASRASDQNKLICVCHPDLRPAQLPAPFPANDHILELNDRSGLIKALKLLIAR